MADTRLSVHVYYSLQYLTAQFSNYAKMFSEYTINVRVARQNLGNHVAVVVVSQSTGKLFVVHHRPRPALTPQPSHGLRVNQLELAVTSGPLDHRPELSISQQLQQKLPQLNL